VNVHIGMRRRPANNLSMTTCTATWLDCSESSSRSRALGRSCWKRGATPSRPRQLHWFKTMRTPQRLAEVSRDVESTQMIRYPATLRTRRPPYPTSSGKCFLAYAGDTFPENYLAAHIPDEDIREQVRAELRTIANEVAPSTEDKPSPTSAVSVPVFGNRQLLAVLAMAGPTTRIADRLDEFAAAAKQEDCAVVCGFVESRRVAHQVSEQCQLGVRGVRPPRWPGAGLGGLPRPRPRGLRWSRHRGFR